MLVDAGMDSGGADMRFRVMHPQDIHPALSHLQRNGDAFNIAVAGFSCSPGIDEGFTRVADQDARGKIMEVFDSPQQGKRLARRFGFRR